MDSIYQYISSSGFPPTFEEMRENIGVSSNQSVIDLLAKLEKIGCIRRNESAARSISILPLGYQMLGHPPLVPFLGATTAGMPMEAIELKGEWQEISGTVAKFKDEVFLLKVIGDSMINAGIDDSDVVLVQSKKYFVTGEIVLANTDNGATVKRFMSVDTPPYTYLKPENPKYDILLFTDDVELQGKVLSVLKRDQWVAVK